MPTGTATAIAVTDPIAPPVFRRSTRSPRGRRSGAPGADERLRQLIEEHAPSAYRVALSIVRDPALAEDVVQETMIKAWTAMDGFEGSGTMRSWVLAIAHNTAVSTLRRLREEATEPDRFPERASAADLVEQTVEDRARLELLWQAVADLDDLSREILLLRDVEGLPYQDIVAATGVPLATVKTRLLRARRSLQQRALATTDLGGPHE